MIKYTNNPLIEVTDLWFLAKKEHIYQLPSY